MNKIFNIFKLVIFKFKWKHTNAHNYTTVGNLFPSDRVKVGRYTYGRLNIRTFGAVTEELEIKDFVSIAGDVVFFLGGEHNLKSISTYPFGNRFCSENKTISKGKITVEDDVWIGNNALILSGVFIGRGAVIGAGAVVAKDIPPYAVAIGNPARIIKYRFDDEIITNLLKLDFSLISKSIYIENKELFDKNLDRQDLLKINEILELSRKNEH